MHCCHLATLHKAGALVGMQDGDIDPIAAGKGLDSGGTGISGGRADNGDALVALGQHIVEQAPEHLHGHVFEGEGGAVEQFLREQMRIELDQRRDGGVAETGIGLATDFLQYFERDRVPDERLHHSGGQRVVRQTAHGTPIRGREMRP